MKNRFQTTSETTTVGLLYKIWIEIKKLYVNISTHQFWSLSNDVLTNTDQNSTSISHTINDTYKLLSFTTSKYAGSNPAVGIEAGNLDGDPSEDDEFYAIEYVDLSSTSGFKGVVIGYINNTTGALNAITSNDIAWNWDIFDGVSDFNRVTGSKTGLLITNDDTINVATKTLDVRGDFRLTDGTESNGYVLTSDANGNASWQDTDAKVINYLNSLPTYANDGDAGTSVQFYWSNSGQLHKNATYTP